MNTADNSVKTSPSLPKLKVVQPKHIAVPNSKLPENRADTQITDPPVASRDRNEEKVTETLKPQSQVSPRKWLVVGTLALGLVGVGLIPIEHKVKGDSVIDSAPLNRQTISLPQGSAIEKLGVFHNQQVKAGDFVVQLSDEQLSQQLLAVEQKLVEAKSEYKLAQQTNRVYLQKQQQVEVNAASAARRAKERQRDIESSDRGILPEQLLELQHTKAAIDSERKGIQDQLNLLNQEIDRYEPLEKQGGLPWTKLNEAYQERASLENQLKTKEWEIKQSEAKIKAGKRQLADELSDRRDEAREKEMALAAQVQEVQVAGAEMNKWRNQIVQLEKQQFQLQQREKGLTVKADVSGLAIAPEIDKWRGQKLPEAKEIQIVDTANLPAVVMVEEYYAAPIQAGMLVTYIPKGQHQKYTAKVQSLELPVFDETTKKRMVPVRIAFDDPNNRFVLGTSGQATIHVKQVRVYESVFREVYKVFNPLINQLR